jgi:ribosomal protein L11 methyltransferase
VLAEACAALGAGCRERELGGGEVALDFWLPAARAGVAEELRDRLGPTPIEVRLAPEDDDWRAAMRAFHRPIEVAGRLRVRPPWAAAREGLLDVAIDPGMTFGTGQHATTRACLELLCALPPGPLVDVGCGSGVLAVAARRLGHDPVWALDADPLCVEATIRNARANGVGLRVSRRAVGRDPIPPAPAVLANLTATVLVALAAALADAPPERAVLSGLRPDEAPATLRAFAPLGLYEADRREADGWVTLLAARR